ncbi:hypothetical protein SOCE26_086660 [Sorangium cellulosum]|uniref:Uncharacterized protein n=1 Tax=Sorangium cellulosum TaxID=56 RepID=A0A2L0F6D8_SORCE|nr:hypothetical protein [Sorangium cellulosum]AUX47154.1 hypothetical protein SOCE26_086660 [Sorangium cellulosum]
MRAWLNFLSFMSIAGGLGVACTGRIGPAGDLSGGDGGSSGVASTTGPSGPASTAGPATTSAASGGGDQGCGGTPDDDADGDGFTEGQGDCNDCNPLVNPGAIELATVGGEGGAAPGGVDDDCDGEIDDVPVPCDGDLALDDRDPFNAAKAVELCKMSSGPGDWGVVSASWVLVDGTDPPEDPELNENFHRGHGILTGFGPNVSPRGGSRLLALSSGTARQQDDPGFESPEGFNKGYSCEFPQGFPKHPSNCTDPVPASPEDPTALEITLRVPSNVRGFSFHVNYNTFDWPDLCSDFNDFFIALLSPAPPDRIDGHLLFDTGENAMSVNSDFIDVCNCAGGPPCVLGGKSFACSSGTRELLGTGFENHAATSWLVTSAPVEPNQEIKIRWGAYDAGDYQHDSTGLIDNWQWIADPGVTVTTKHDPPPDPAP